MANQLYLLIHPNMMKQTVDPRRSFITSSKTLLWLSRASGHDLSHHYVHLMMSGIDFGIFCMPYMCSLS